jgi:hypothetical protein
LLRLLRSLADHNTATGCAIVGQRAKVGSFFRTGDAPQPADAAQDLAEECSPRNNLCELKHEIAVVAHDPAPELGKLSRKNAEARAPQV